MNINSKTMLYNTSYYNKEYIECVDTVLGKSFSFLERIKRRGIGSGKIIISNFSKQFYTNVKQFADTNYANIEMRPKGVIIHFTRSFERFAWVVPFYKLHVYSSEFYSIHADGEFIKFKKDKLYRNNKKFLTEMMNEKIAFLDLGYYDG